MLGRHNDAKAAVVPGPGAYEAKGLVDNYSSRNEITMSGRQVDKERQHFTGPGTYNPPSRLTKDSARYTMRPKHKTLSKDNTPGAGTYEIKTTVGTAVKKSFGARGRSPREPSVPGPGAYKENQNAIKTRGPAFGMHQPSVTARSLDLSAIQPGPGAYESKDNIGKKAMTMHGRVAGPAGDNTPGPKYNPKSASDRSAPSYSMRGRYNAKTKPGAPGPGAYKQPASIDKPNNFTFGGRRSQKERSTPGAGTYSPRISSSSPRYTMAGRTGTGSTFSSSTNPGFKIYE
jgi:hypothetical protein